MKKERYWIRQFVVIIVVFLVALLPAIYINQVEWGETSVNETVNIMYYNEWRETPIRTSGDIIKTGYAQGIQETSIVEVVQEEYIIITLIGLPVFTPRKVIGKTVIGKLVNVEFKETGIFFKKNNVVLTFEDSENGGETTVVTAKCAKQQIWQKGKVQEIKIIDEKVESVQIKNYEI